MPTPTLADLLAKATPAYSVIAFAGSSPVSPDALGQVTRLLKGGAKVMLVASTEPDLSGFKDWLDAKLLRVFIPDPAFKHPVPVLFLDTQRDDKLFTQLDKLCPAFNDSQHVIEHAPVDAQLGIKAGAGTGKTATMVDRVLFLLHMATPDLSPREIVMITFTKEATHEMRQRLRKALVTRYRLTTQPRYLTWLEEVGAMPIKTIHAYSRELIVQLGSASGLSRDLQIRNFQLERKQIIEALLNQHLPAGKPVGDTLKAHLYDFIDRVNDFWGEMANKGLSESEIAQLQWGHADPPADAIQTILSEVVPQAETQLRQLKQATDALSLGDLTREVDRLRPQVTKLKLHLSPLPRYLFVDEFQDTDNAQIKLVAWLHDQLQVHLFVVGDIKQSIYRFRGANYTAFGELEEQLQPLGTKLDFRQLTKNYRTGRVLLDKMHPYFDAWNQMDLLDYKKTDQLTGVVDGGDPIKTVKTGQDWEPVVLDMIEKAVASLPSDDVDAQVALLVRTNKQARDIKRLCEENGIDCEVDAGGDFWVTDAVTDFYHLLRALLYPGDMTARLDLHASSYSARTAPWDRLTHLEGNATALRDVLDVYPPHENWAKWLDSLRLRPVLAVLREIIDEAEPVVRYYHANEQDEEKANEYSRNLGKLLLTLQETFPSRTVSLHSICQYIALKRVTDREEDRAPSGKPRTQVRLLCQTVHKAKGKQYHTVLLPFTGHPFRPPHDQEIILRPPDPLQGQTEWTAGWMMKDEAGNPVASDNYNDLLSDEESEVDAEEARLLYVAMTRAKQRLWIALAESKQGKHCWSWLLRQVK